MATTWSDEETLKLIELWGDEEIRALLEGMFLQQACVRENSCKNGGSRFERNVVQCGDKVKKLKGEYTNIKDSNNETPV